MTLGSRLQVAGTWQYAKIDWSARTSFSPMNVAVVFVHCHLNSEPRLYATCSIRRPKGLTIALLGVAKGQSLWLGTEPTTPAHRRTYYHLNYWDAPRFDPESGRTCADVHLVTEVLDRLRSFTKDRKRWWSHSSHPLLGGTLSHERSKNYYHFCHKKLEGGVVFVTSCDILRKQSYFQF